MERLTDGTPNPKVWLRQLEPEDVHLLYDIENDVSLWHLNEDPSPFSRIAVKNYLMTQPHNIFQSGELRLVVMETATNEAVGLVDLVNFSPTDSRAEVGIALLDEKRSKGLGASALMALERYAKTFAHIRMLYAQVLAEGNPLAHSLFCGRGYKLVATLPQWHSHDGKWVDIQIYQKMIGQ